MARTPSSSLKTREDNPIRWPSSHFSKTQPHSLSSDSTVELPTRRIPKERPGPIKIFSVDFRQRNFYKHSDWLEASGSQLECLKNMCIVKFIL